MSLCFDCKHVAPLGPRPASDFLRIQSGQWGMLARGLIYCSHREPGQTYDRFRSVESKDECKCFEPELNQELVANRIKTVQVLRASFDQWIQELRNKHNNGRTRG